MANPKGKLVEGSLSSRILKALEGEKSSFWIEQKMGVKSGGVISPLSTLLRIGELERRKCNGIWFYRHKGEPEQDQDTEFECAICNEVGNEQVLGRGVCKPCKQACEEQSRSHDEAWDTEKAFYWSTKPLRRVA